APRRAAGRSTAWPDTAACARTRAPGSARGTARSTRRRARRLRADPASPCSPGDLDVAAGDRRLRVHDAKTYTFAVVLEEQLGLLPRQQRTQELDLRQGRDARAAPAVERRGDPVEQDDTGHDRAPREVPGQRCVRGRYRKTFAEFAGAHRASPRDGLAEGRRALI